MTKLQDDAAPDSSKPGSRSARERSQRQARTEDLLTRLSDCLDPDERHALIDELVLANMGVADAVVSRYRSRGVAVEDLQQVAYMALVKAAGNFDTARGNDFLTYTVPTIRGEVRRYFRDHGWMVRPPRRIQELQSHLSRGCAELGVAIGREPSPRELAEWLDEDEADVREALCGAGCFTPASLDRPIGEEGSATMGDLILDDDEPSRAAEARAMLAPLVRRLGARDREILRMRFICGLTQQEIADVLGVTQVQVSRLLSRIYSDLRRQLGRVPPESLAS